MIKTDFRDLALKDLGPRICLIGPSSTGKSTLAHRLSQKLGYPCLHLDQIHHQPHTNWEKRPADEYLKLHDEFILHETWVIEGNYSSSFQQRFDRATVVIYHDMNKWPRLYRYIKRNFDHPSKRYGKLEGATSDFNWHMIGWILYGSPKNRAKYMNILSEYDLPVIFIHSLTELNKLYRHFDL